MKKALTRLVLCTAVAAACMASAEPAEETVLPALTDQLNRRIAFRAHAEAGVDMLSAWTPSEANGFTAAEEAAYIHPSDVRVRQTEGGGAVPLTCASGGLCAVAEYPSGKKLWAHTVPRADNSHAVELLPNGCVAVAASSGCYVRVYPAGGGESGAQTHCKGSTDQSAHPMQVCTATVNFRKKAAKKRPNPWHQTHSRGLPPFLTYLSQGRDKFSPGGGAHP